MDETDAAQTPAELLIILAAIADEGIPVQTIAPKFTGRFNRASVTWATSRSSGGDGARRGGDRLGREQFRAPQESQAQHSLGQRQFSIYPAIYETTKKSGVHLKTAGTTWLEEIIGLAEAAATARAGEGDLCGSVRASRGTVRSLRVGDRHDPAKLPAPATVAIWTSDQFTSALRHDPHSPAYNSSLRSSCM